MEVVTLGTGTLAPSPNRASSCLAVIEGEHVAVVDLGRNALARMVEAGIDPLAREAFLLTHLHPDHCCELVSLLFARNYADVSRPRPLALIGPRGLEELIDALVRAWRWLEPKHPLEIVEIGPGTLDPRRTQPWFGFIVEAVGLEHGGTENLGFRFTSPRTGKVVAFTGDTGPCPGLEVLARGVDLLVAECSTLDAAATASHLAPTALGDAARRAGAKRLILTHLQPETSPAGALAAAAAAFGGPVALARDGLRWAV